MAGVMKLSTPLPALAASSGSVLVFPCQRVYDTSPVIGHLAMERECHTVDPPPASPSCQRLFYIYLFLFLCPGSLLKAGNTEI